MATLARDAVLNAISRTDDEVIARLKGRLSAGDAAAAQPACLDVSGGNRPGSIRALLEIPQSEQCSFESFEAFSAAVEQHNEGGGAASGELPVGVEDEAASWRLLHGLISARPVVGVMGGYFPREAMRNYYDLGVRIAEAGCHLLTGGGGTLCGGPVVSAVAGFTSVAGRAGRSIAIVPNELTEGLNPLNDTLILTNLPSGTLFNSRNHLNVLLSDVLVVLAGGPGTLHEIGLCLSLKRPTTVDQYWRLLANIPDTVGHEEHASAISGGRYGFLAMGDYWKPVPEGQGGADFPIARELSAVGRETRDEVRRLVAGDGAMAAFRTAAEAWAVLEPEVRRLIK